MAKILMFLPFHLVLKPLIKRNYKLRAFNVKPDKWYWADILAVQHGYFVPCSECYTNVNKSNS